MSFGKPPIYLVAQRKTDAFFRGWIPPFGILCVGKALQDAGYRVRAFHLSGDDDEALKEAVRAEGPLFVGFSNSVSPTVERDIRLSKWCHEQGAKVVWGGMFATSLPEETLAAGYVDYVVVGEGERPAVALADAIESGVEPAGVPGAGYRRGEEIILEAPQPPEPDLDKHPHAMDLIDWSKYVLADNGEGAGITSLNISRGCPFRCYFCYNSMDATRRNWRSYSLDYVRDQVSYLKKRYDISTVCFQDDNPFGKVAEAMNLIGGLEVEWMSACHLKVVSPDFLKWCDDTGCRILCFGAESGSDRMLKAMNKGVTSDDLRERLGMCRDAKLQTWSSWMAFLPDETVDDRRLTFSLMDEIYHSSPNHRMRLAAFEAYPGTPFWDDCVKLGLKVPQNLEEWANYEKRIHRLQGCTDRQVKRMTSESMLLYSHGQSEKSPVPAALRPILRRRFRNGTFRGPLEETLHYGRVLRDNLGKIIG
jgi:radical SAM superfamily enzyme YgiQ (UPF0313 family)